MLTKAQQKILIIDDHQLFIDGIKALLLDMQASFYEALTANGALKLIQTHDFFDLILLDIKMPGMSGLSFLRKIKALKNASPILVISAEESPQLIKDALDLGALGFVSKKSSSSALNLAIDTVIKKHIYLAPTWCYLLDEKRHNKTIVNDSGITARQIEVLHLAAQGISNKVISIDLGISENTVKSHLHALFTTLDVTNRIKCIQKAKELGLITQLKN